MSKDAKTFKVDSLTIYHTIQTFKNPGKGENAAKQHFLLFPQCFLPIPKRMSVVKLHLFCRLQML